MNSRVQKLVEALRSGEYKQAIHKLCRVEANGEASYCCLGVACEIYQKEVGDLRVEEINRVRVYDSSDAVLPYKVQKWFGFQDDCGLFDEDEFTSSSLASINDHGFDFNKIANTIESNPSGLLVPENES